MLQTILQSWKGDDFNNIIDLFMHASFWSNEACDCPIEGFHGKGIIVSAI